MRPSLPEPSPRAAGLTLCSSMILAAAGRGAWPPCAWLAWAATSAGGVDGRATGPAGGGGVVTPGPAGCGSSLTGAGACAATLGDGVPPAEMEPRTVPTSTSLPSGTEGASITPATLAFTSTVTLSVSSSTTGSSAVTASPACFSQRATVAVVTLSPKVGTIMSAMQLKLPRKKRLGGDVPSPPDPPSFMCPG